jgi:signal transduction histidine kinase
MEYATLDGDTLETVWVRTEYEPVRLQPGFRYTRRSDEPTERVPYIQFDPRERAEREPPDHPVHLLLEEGVRSALACPLTEGGATTGYLFFCSTLPDTYTVFHVWVITRIAAVAAGALAQARLTEELERRNEELRRVDALRARYLATISHELRTPLTSVVGLSATLRDDLETLSEEEVSELAGLIAEQAQDMAAIIEDLLVVARSEPGDEPPVSAEPVDLASTALDVIESLGGGARVRGAAVAVADPRRVRQVLRNLLTNARRHGGPDIDVEVTESNGWSQVTVTDDGDGVAPEVIDSLFQPFAHSDDHRDSIGLGLWVSNRLAGLMGGDLEYERNDGLTAFCLRLPSRR